MRASKYKVYYSALMDEFYTVYFNKMEGAFFVFDGSGTYLMSTEQLKVNLIYIGEL